MNTGNNRRSLLVVLAVLLFAGLFPTFAIQPSKEALNVIVVVSVPAETPDSDKIFLTGNLDVLGKWSARGVPLERQSDGSWQGQFVATVGQLLECKVTRGTWQSVEKNKSGEEISNHQLLVEKGSPLEIRVLRWADIPVPGPNTLTGNVRIHRNVASTALSNKRDVLVYLPPTYNADPKRRFPVLYVHDGQNVFDSGTSFQGVEWEIDETAERLIKSGKLAPLIIVAVANTFARVDEYTPVLDPKHQAGGNGDAYAQFLLKELKPMIDKTYRTFSDRENTGIAGSSLGGLISLYVAARHPEAFSRCGALSPSIWWADCWIVQFLTGHLADLKNTRFWVDMGSKEGSSPADFAENLGNLEKVRRIFQKAGLKSEVDFFCREIEGGCHSESAWAARFDQVLLKLFPVVRGGTRSKS